MINHRFNSVMIFCGISALLLSSCQAQNNPAIDPNDANESRVCPGNKQAVPEKLSGEIQQTVEGNNAFGFDLYAKLTGGSEGNVFFSPYSVSTALAMAWGGARGETETQMAQALHFPLPQQPLHRAFAALQKQFNRPAQDRGYQLSVANALWGQKQEVFLPEFLTLTETYYQAGLHQVDFVTETEAARQTINAWVEKQTQDKIKELIPKGVLGPMIRLVLTNAIYFKGDWAGPFDEKNTRPRPFHIAADKQVEVPLMNQDDEFPYAQLDGVQILELPYAKEQLSMLVVLPERIDGLKSVEKSLSAPMVQGWLSQLRPRKVVMYVPKFKMTCEFTLSQILSGLGMPVAFTGQADFSGMNGQKNLFISEVLHKAFVEVNEEGTEAAAATGVVMRTTAVAQPAPVFRADHPFLFIIRDRHTGSILFMGRVSDPRAD